MSQELDRATYFELKVKGFHDNHICRVFDIGYKRMNLLRERWGFKGVHTDSFERMMIRARKGQAHIYKNGTEEPDYVPLYQKGAAGTSMAVQN